MGKFVCGALLGLATGFVGGAAWFNITSWKNREVTQNLWDLYDAFDEGNVEIIVRAKDASCDEESESTETEESTDNESTDDPNPNFKMVTE